MGGTPARTQRVAGALAGMRRVAGADVRFAAGVPNVGPFGDPLVLTDLAVAAEDSGWDGFFIWDHLLYRDQSWPVADPTVVIAAVAARTSRIRFGVLMNQLARRRVGKVARESVTLDRLSGGRLILGAGLGSVPEEFTAFGEPGDLRERAARLDESLEVLTELWRGEPVTFHGEHVTVTGVTMLPPPLQQPRIPIWCGGRWPAKAPFRRAARCDGVMPTHTGYGLGETMPPAELAAVMRYIREHRQDGAPPLAVALEGRTDGAAADRGGRHVGAYHQAGLTWWVEALGLVALRPGRRDGQDPARPAAAELKEAGSRRTSTCPAAIASRLWIGWFRPGSTHGQRERPELTLAGMLPPSGQRGVLIAAPAGDYRCCAIGRRG